VPAKNGSNREQARALRAAGARTAEIAAALGVSPSTVRRWARQDARADEEVGAPERGHPARRPVDRLILKLERRLAKLVENEDEKAEPARIEDRMLKLCKVLDYLRAGRDDLTGQLEAMRGFAAFCLQNLPEPDMDPVRKAIRLFVEQLRKEHS